MRLSALALTAILIAQPLFAQQPPSSSAQDTATHSQDAKPQQTQDAKPKDAKPAQDPKPLDLPVSLDKIKEALGQAPRESLKGLDERPTFRIEVRERQKLDELLKTLKFDTPPPIPATMGGVYGYEQQRLMFNPVDNPLAQPWSAFTGPQLATVASTSFIEALLAKFFARRMANAITTSQRVSAEQEAREDVKRAIAEYCAAQPNHGAGIRLCLSPDAIR
jgi:hypothetical protein